jgi:hypothetical protein
MFDPLLVSFAFLGIGAASTLRTLQANHRRGDSRFWPITRGEIIDSGLTVETTRDADGRAVTLYGVAVRYRFQLGRRFYENTRIRWSERPKSRRSARQRKLLARYPVGRIVQVHYDPDTLGVAVLEPASKIPLQLGWVFSLAFLMLGSAGVIAATLP